MRSEVFKYGKMDGRAKRLTALWIVVMAALILLIWRFSGEGGYTVAWGISLIVAVLLLLILSIPRRVVVTDSALEIRCIVEMTRISFADLRSVRKIDREEMKKTLLVVGSYGFFGYYGYYFNRRNWETVRLYCTEWNNFVEITDAYEKKYIISCPQADRLIALLAESTTYYREEET